MLNNNNNLPRCAQHSCVPRLQVFEVSEVNWLSKLRINSLKELANQPRKSEKTFIMLTSYKSLLLLLPSFFIIDLLIC